MTFDEIREIISNPDYKLGYSDTVSYNYVVLSDGNGSGVQRLLQLIDELEETYKPVLTTTNHNIREDPTYTVKGRSLTEKDIEAFVASGELDKVAQKIADLYDGLYDQEED